MPVSKVVTDIEPVNSANKLIVQEFQKLIEQIKFDIDHAPSKGESMTNHFRLRQITGALNTLAKYPKPIKSGKQLKGIKGIGKGTMDRIDEILQTGKLAEITIRGEEKKYLSYIQDLEQVIGIGRKTAYDLVVNYNIKSVAQLKKAYNDGTINLSDQVVTGLKYYGVYKQTIPREEITKISDFIGKQIRTFSSDVFSVVCGSYRRLKPTSNDVDLLITNPKVKSKLQQQSSENYLITLVKRLKDIGFILDDLTDKDYETKYMGFCQYTDNGKKLPIRRIDIRYIAYDSFFPALLYFTGSGEFNRKMRLMAIELGYKLSEYGLYKIKGETETKVKVNSEEEIFEKLGMEYLPPEKRT